MSQKHTEFFRKDRSKDWHGYWGSDTDPYSHDGRKAPGASTMLKSFSGHCTASSDCSMIYTFWLIMDELGILPENIYAGFEVSKHREFRHVQFLCFSSEALSARKVCKTFAKHKSVPGWQFSLLRPYNHRPPDQQVRDYKNYCRKATVFQDGLLISAGDTLEEVWEPSADYLEANNFDKDKSALAPEMVRYWKDRATHRPECSDSLNLMRRIVSSHALALIEPSLSSSAVTFLSTSEKKHASQKIPQSDFSQGFLEGEIQIESVD